MDGGRLLSQSQSYPADFGNAIAEVYAKHEAGVKADALALLRKDTK